MLKLKDIKKENGVILLTVIMLTIILSIVAISIMSIHLSHRRSSKSIVKSLRAEQLAMGVFMRYQQIRNQGCPGTICGTQGDCATCPKPTDEIFDGVRYSFNIVETGTPGPNDTEEIQVLVTYQ